MSQRATVAKGVTVGKEHRHWKQQRPWCGSCVGGVVVTGDKDDASEGCTNAIRKS